MSRPTALSAFHYGHLSFALRPGHRYPLPRYAWLRQRALDSGLFYPQHIIAGQPADDDVLALAHTRAYIAAISAGMLSRPALRLLNLPWSPQLVRRARCIVGATLAAGQRALGDGLSFVLGGGTHHAHADHGSGFCIFNDSACAARRLQVEGQIARAAVLDCDVHQGDGTATILADDETIFTASVHAAGNFPFSKARGDFDIALPNGAGDDLYLAAVQRALDATLAHAPDLLFYVAGADPHIDDRLGKLHVSSAGLAARDRLVLTTCRARRLPVVVLMGGGYSEPLDTTVALNMQTVAIGCAVWQAATAAWPIAVNNDDLDLEQMTDEYRP